MKLTATACAKINLTLDITGVRSDGYHLVEMIMQSVSLCDTITVETTDNTDIIVTSSRDGLGGREDITYKAAELFFKNSGVIAGAKIHTEKRIPCAAGLGGGSSDAAAVLLALNKLYGNPISKKALEEIALKLGADVPYFLFGGTVLVSGIGEILEPLNAMPHCYIVIAKNAVKPSTAEMYRRIDNGNFDHPDNNAAVSSIKNNDFNALCGSIGNVFQNLWSSSDIADVLKECGADAFSLSGSGPSYFGLFQDKQAAKHCIETLKSMNIEAYFTEPTQKVIFFE